MRIAILSDIHGNRTAFEAVLRDLKQTSPDLVLHGGDLADSGSSPAEIVDRIRDLGWAGVLGNTDEIHTRPESLDEFVAQSSAPASLWTAVREIAAWTDSQLGAERIEWLRSLPRVLIHESFALVHASPESAWKAPTAESSDTDFQEIYGCLDRPTIVFGHIHRSFLRRISLARLGEMLVANSGSVSLSYDGDPRAAYLLIDGSGATIRRVHYDIDKEARAALEAEVPHAEWIARTLMSSPPQLP